MKIQTERLTVAPFGYSSSLELQCNLARNIYEYASDPEVTKNVLWAPHKSIVDTVIYLNEAKNDYYIYLDDTIIGAINFSPIDIRCHRWHLGYVLNPRYQGKGYMTESVQGVVKYAFTKMDSVHRIEAVPRCGNKKSASVLSRCGFVSEAVLTDYYLINGKYHNAVMYRMLKQQFEDSIVYHGDVRISTPG